METMKLLLAIAVVSTSILQVDCKVIKQPTKWDDTIDLVSPKLDSRPTKSSKAANLTAVSIKQTNSSTSNFNSLTSTSHIPRSFGKVKKLKKSLKKMFITYAYYGPELGLCSCLFKFAWYTYPIVPEVTYAAMGRARRMIGSFLQDFMYGYQDSYNEYEYHHDHDRISNKVAETTADDYDAYQSRFTSNRRIGAKTDTFENTPLIQQTDPKIARVVEMLKYLKPKSHQNDSFVIRYARALNTLNINQDSAPMAILKEIARYLQTSNMTKSTYLPNEGRNINFPYVDSNTRRTQGPPPGLPGYSDLPPADYHYFKDDVYHHVHDLRKNKRGPPRSGGWLSLDFTDAILTALGLAPPGRSYLKPTAAGCGKAYIFNVLLRFVQTTFF